MKKSETLARWKALEANQNPIKHMTPIPYKSRGSRYGACGVRIDGNPQFIDAVLSCLKPLLCGENGVTRLELARTEVDGSKLGKAFDNADRHAEVCYIRLHQRGHDAQMVNMYFGVERTATLEYAMA